MLRTIRAIALGAAVICLALPARRADASNGASDGKTALLPADPDADPAPLVEPIDPDPAVTFTPAGNDVPAFVWTSDLTLAPPPYAAASTRDAHLAPPSATTTAIPLPPAAWTGLGTMGALGTVALLRRLYRGR